MIASRTWTFLFTDIEGSTRLWERQPEAMRRAIARHNELLRTAIAAHGGQVFRTAGDAVCAAFAAAPAAVAAAAAAQRALYAESWELESPIRVRIALHSGEAEAVGGDFVGAGLNRLGRLLPACHGGQTLLTLATEELARDALPEGARLLDLGPHRFRDLASPERVFQLALDGLPVDFPPLAALEAVPHNLPLALTSFVGRQRELEEVKRRLGVKPNPPNPPSRDGKGGAEARVSPTPLSLLERRGAEIGVDPSPTSLLGKGAGGFGFSRLITLTGPGGTGKTRLALQAASETLERFPDGAWLVELAPISDPNLALPAIAASLRLREQPGRPLREALVDFLRPRRLLLLLDNCEHIVETCAEAAEELVRRCPDLIVLASSREPLGVAGEQVLRVPSMELPAPGPLPPLDNLLQNEAVRLFAERAAAVQPRFALSEHNAPAVVQICRRLDGIPLAIELAAARARSLSPEQIAARLDDRFRLLTGGSRTALPRQQTLEALIDWSYDLLPPEEAALLRRLSVFVGGFTLEAVEAVSSEKVGGWKVYPVEGLQDLQPSTLNIQPIDLLDQLVNKSLVIADEQEEGIRYRLLETLRQYAGGKLLAAGEAQAARDRHLAYFAAFAHQADEGLRGAEQFTWLARLELEHDNLRAALEWGLGRDPQTALHLAADLALFWARRGYAVQGRRWMEEALQRTIGAEPSTGEETGAGASSMSHGLDRAWALIGLGVLEIALGESEAALHSEEQAVALSRQSGNRSLLANALGMAALAASFLNDRQTLRAYGEESLALARQSGDSFALGMALGGMGMAFGRIFSDIDVAERFFHESIQAFRVAGDRWHIGQPLMGLGMMAFRRGDFEAGKRYLEECLEIFRQAGDQTFFNVTSSGLADIARAQKELHQAVRLYQEILARWRDLGNRGGVARCLECLAFLAGEMAGVEAGTAERAPGTAPSTAASQANEGTAAPGAAALLEWAAVLLGAAGAIRQAGGALMAFEEQPEYDRFVPALRRLAEEQGLGEAFSTAWERGREMSIDQVVSYARQPGLEDLFGSGQDLSGMATGRG